MSGPAAELPTEPPASWRRDGRRSLPPNFSLVAAAIAPLPSLHVKPAAAYTKDVSPTDRRHGDRMFPPPTRRLSTSSRTDLSWCPMEVVAESLQLVATALAEYLQQPRYGDAEFAERYQALPLHAGWTGTTYLTTSGEFWFRNCEFDPPRIENDLNEASKLVALVLAAEHHPQLVALLPPRPDDAPACDACDGRGQITVGNVSNIICGQCSALGWQVPGGRTRDHGFYPSFDRALAQFRSFIGKHGLGTDFAFISAEHALLVGDQLYITAEALQPDVSTRQIYERAVARRLGVALGAVGELPKRRLGVYVYGPTTENEAERLMYPDGLKMTIPERNIKVRVVGNAKMWLLRLRHGRRNARRTREYFR